MTFSVYLASIAAMCAALCGCGLAPERPESPNNWGGTVWIRNGPSYGCGVVIWESGLILTDRHVVDRKEPVTVFASDEEDTGAAASVRADILKTSDDELALLRVPRRFNHAVRIAPATDAAPGDLIYGVMLYPMFGKIVDRGFIARTHYTYPERDDPYFKDVLVVSYDGLSGSSGSGVFRAHDGALIGLNLARARYVPDDDDELVLNFVIPGYKIVKFLDDLKAPYHPARTRKKSF